MSPGGGDRRGCVEAARLAARAMPASASSPPRRSGSRGSATRWPSASRAAGGCWRSARPPPTGSDVRHVAVEFVHPVIVGKRALPALGARTPAEVALLARPDDIVIAFGGGSEVEAAVRDATAPAA